MQWDQLIGLKCFISQNRFFCFFRSCYFNISFESRKRLGRMLLKMLYLPTITTSLSEWIFLFRCYFKYFLIQWYQLLWCFYFYPFMFREWLIHSGLGHLAHAVCTENLIDGQALLMLKVSKMFCILNIDDKDNIAHKQCKMHKY